MRCPVCRYENFEGEDSCQNCGADLRTVDIPQPATSYGSHLLGTPLGALDVGGPQTIPPDASARSAIQRMHAEAIDCLLVVEGGRLAGIFTDRDAILKATGASALDQPVRAFMTPDPVTLRHDDPLAVAIHKMADGEFRHIPIIDGSEPIGVVSAPDVFRHLASLLG